MHDENECLVEIMGLSEGDFVLLALVLAIILHDTVVSLPLY